MFSLPSYCRVWVHWSRVCFHARCDCSMHNADECPLSLFLPFPHPLMLRVLFCKIGQLDPVLSKVPDSHSYSYLASWEFPSHFHVSALGKGHFFALKSVHWEPALYLSHALSLKRPHRNTGNVVSAFIGDRDNCRPDMSNATWKMTPSPGWCIFFYLLTDFFITI